jgi:hypothetical protein
MPYSSFTLKEVKKVFGITLANSQFSQSATPIIPSNWLNDLLQESIPLAITLSTEKARSEFIIAPLLFELRKSLAPHVGLFSGTDFTVAPEEGLNGVCDFLLTRSQEESGNEIVIAAPAIIIIEAKKGDMNAGLGQPATQGSEEISEQSVAVCAAEMVAAQRFNNEAGETIENIYGAVTTGTQWQFLKLTGHELNIDMTEYALTPIERILGILHWMVNHP